MEILIVKTSALGDILHTFPVIAFLKEKYPGCAIDWVVERGGAELVQAHPDVRDALIIDSRKWRKALFSKNTWLEMGRLRRHLRKTSYDLLIDLQGNVKSALIVASARAKEKIGFGWKQIPEWPAALVTHRRYNPPLGHNIRDDYLFVAQSFVGDMRPFDSPPVELRTIEMPQLELPAMRRVLVAAGSHWLNKKLPLARLLEYLKGEEGFFLLAWGNEQEREEALFLHRFLPSMVLPKLSLPQLAHLMKEVDCVVAMDSLPLHLAAVVGKPTVSFFGPSSPRKYAPPGAGHRTFQGLCPYGVTFEKRCPRLRSCPTGHCIKHSVEGGLSSNDRKGYRHGEKST